MIDLILISDSVGTTFEDVLSERLRGNQRRDSKPIVGGLETMPHDDGIIIYVIDDSDGDVVKCTQAEWE